jgi:flagellar hook-associated protein 1 FlgK
MASILDGLNIAKLSLSAEQYAMTVAERNSVNVNNPNYTRQDVLFTDLTVPGNWSAFGVPGVSLWAVRNSYLDRSISYEIPEFNENLVKYNALREIDYSLHGTSGGGLIESIRAFFNSFTELSSDPTDSALRWQVMSSAETMTQDFHRIYDEILRVQANAEQHIVSGVVDINKLTAKIADLNGRIEAAHTKGERETEYALRDERQQAVEELEAKINVLYFETESGSITVTTSNGDALVLGRKSTDIVLGPRTGSPFSDIYYGSNTVPPGVNITASITSGEIGGYLQVRDTLIPDYLERLDDMAAAIETEVNFQHGLGNDINGFAGGTFFSSTPLPSPPWWATAGIARTINLVIASPDDIAAAAIGGGTGDNQNAKKLAAIAVTPIPIGGQTVTLGEAYASLIYTVGSDQRIAKETGEHQQNLINQLLTQRHSESGVSLNEEAINIIKYQQAYQASSRIVSVLNILSAEILNFVRV